MQSIEKIVAIGFYLYFTSSHLHSSLLHSSLLHSSLLHSSHLHSSQLHSPTTLSIYLILISREIAFHTYKSTSLPSLSL
jgi:hypothetical protein